jgi:large subunit ribosomal protein L4
LHVYKLPKKVCSVAFKSALSRRTEENALTVFEAFELSEIKTRGFVDVMNKFEFEDLLLVLSEKDETVMKSARNISGVKVLPAEGLNVYDILDHKNLAMTSAAVDAVVARLEA